METTCVFVMLASVGYCGITGAPGVLNQGMFQCYV